MRFNITKCKVISYTPKLSPPTATINLHDIPLELVPYYKYLGIMLSPSMDYDAQWERVQNTIRTVSHLISSLKKLGFRKNDSN